MAAERWVYTTFGFSVYIIYNYNNQIYHRHYATSGYHKNELLSVNTLRELQLWSRSQTREQNFVECIASIL
jgi:hypothetical protein